MEELFAVDEEREVSRDNGSKGALSAYWSLDKQRAGQVFSLKGLGDESQVFQIYDYGETVSSIRQQAVKSSNAA